MQFGAHSCLICTKLQCCTSPCSIALQTAGWKALGSNPIRVTWDFSALAGSYPELVCFGPSWKAWSTQPSFIHIMDASESVALITWPTLQVSPFPGLVNNTIFMTVSVVRGPVKQSQTEMDLCSIIRHSVIILHPRLHEKNKSQIKQCRSSASEVCQMMGQQKKEKKIQCCKEKITFLFLEWWLLLIDYYIV